MTLLATRDCGCTYETALGQKRPELCEHGNRYLSEAQLNPKRLKRGSTLKRGKGFAASPEQRRKVRGLPCIVCGQNSGIDIGDGGGVFTVDPAHVYPRRLASCDCAEGVVPLCRADHHRYDDPGQTLDLLPALLAHGYRAELVHAIVAHDVPPVMLLEQVTGQRWAPVDQHGEVAA